MKKYSFPLLILLVLGVICPDGLDTGGGRLLAQGGPPSPPPNRPNVDPPTISSPVGIPIVSPGSDLTLEVVATGEGRLDYQWFFNGSPIRRANQPTLNLKNIEAKHVGTYYVVVANDGGAVRSQNMNVNIRRETTTGIGFSWVNRFEPIRSGFHRPNDIATDSQGNAYVVGEVPNENGDLDFLMIKYDKDGNEEWARLFDPSEGGNDRAQEVRVHPNGNIVVVGTANARNQAGGNPAGRSPQIVALSLSPSGEQIWTHQITAEGIRGAESADVALGANGEILIVGTALGPQNQDILTARLNRDGTQAWSQLFDRGGQDVGESIARDRSGNILVVGTSHSRGTGDDIISIFYNQRGTEIWNNPQSSDGERDDLGRVALFDFRDRPIVVGAMHVQGNGLDFVVTRFSPGGNEQIRKSETSRGRVDDIPVHAVIDRSNAILVAGNSFRNNPGSEAMILKIDARGNIAFAHTLQADSRPGDRVMDAVATSDDGIVLAGGKTNQPFGVDMINAKIDANGANIWDVRFSLIPDAMVFDLATAIDIDPTGDVFLVGVSNSQASGNGTQIGTDTQIITIKQQVTPPTQNTLPVVIINEPAAGTEFQFEQEIFISASATDAEGPIERIELLVGDRVIGVSNTVPFRTSWVIDRVEPLLITARVTDSDGAVVTAATPIEISVTDITPEIVSFPSSQVVTPGQSLTLAAEVTGLEPFRFKWFQNNQRLKQENGPVLQIENFGAEHAGRYHLVVENRVGETRSEQISLELDVPEVVAGDNFADRVSLGGESGRVRVSTIGATRENGEPRHAGKRSNHSVWFSYVAGVRGLVEVSTIGANFDTLLAVYTGTALGNLVEVANDEDRGGKLTSRIRFRAEADQEYIIVVDGFNQQQGRAILTWSFDRTITIDVPRLTVQPSGQFVARRGSLLTYTANFPGPRPPNVRLQWFFNDEPIEGETGEQLQLTDIRPPQVGTYWVVASLGALEARSNDVLLTLSKGRAATAQVVPEVKVEKKFADLFFGVAGANAQALQRQRRGPIRLAASLATGFSGAQIFNTFGAVKELGEPDHCDVPGGASQWFAYQPPIDGTVIMSTDGSDFDTVMAVYTTDSSDFTSLQEVACDNDSGLDGIDSAVSFEVNADTIYYVAIDGVDAAVGLVEMSYAMELDLELSLTATAGGAFEGDGSAATTAFTYTVTAEPNIDFVIEVSDDLVNWTSVVTEQAGPDGTFQFQDDTFDIQTFERYFRVFYP